MDEPGVEARGLAPAQPYLAKIAGVHDRGGLIDLFGSIGVGLRSFCHRFVTP